MRSWGRHGDHSGVHVNIEPGGPAHHCLSSLWHIPNGYQMGDKSIVNKTTGGGHQPAERYQWCLRIFKMRESFGIFLVFWLICINFFVCFLKGCPARQISWAASLGSHRSLSRSGAAPFASNQLNRVARCIISRETFSSERVGLKRPALCCCFLRYNQFKE